MGRPHRTGPLAALAAADIQDSLAGLVSEVPSWLPGARLRAKVTRGDG